MIRFIAAVDSKLGIANDDGIPWQGKIPTDVAYFRKKTLNSAVMMGGGWYEEQIKPLQDRRNIVASTNLKKVRPGFELTNDAIGFLKSFDEGDIWVGGGAGLFESTLFLADELYITRLDADFDCTKFFPEFEDNYNLKSKSSAIIENGITYHFEVWTRKKDLH